MPTYKVTVWKTPPFYSSIEIEAECAADAIQAGKAHDWDNAEFEDCYDWPDPEFILAQSLDASRLPDGLDEASEDLSEERAAAKRTAAMRDRFAEALRAIAALPDNKTGDRGPIKQARHIAKCALSEIESDDINPLLVAAHRMLSLLRLVSCAGNQAALDTVLPDINALLSEIDGGKPDA